MTATANYADILLPAAMFLEYDDIYYGLGHTHLTFGPSCSTARGVPHQHELVCELGRRLGAPHPSFAMTDAGAAGRRPCARRPGNAGTRRRRAAGSIAPLPFESRALPRGLPAGRRSLPLQAGLEDGRAGPCPHARHRRLVAPTTSKRRRASLQAGVPPARNFLNSTFSETPTSIAREGGPIGRMHPDARRGLGLAAGPACASAIAAAGRADRARSRPAGGDADRRGHLARHAFEGSRHQSLIGDDPFPQRRRRLSRYGGVDAGGLDASTCGFVHGTSGKVP